MSQAARAPCVMLQGTGSDVGKSLLIAGFCRLFSSRGLTVRPFKPQNMSNNAAVTADGGEIGRAQALQARAAGIAPTVDMNPILLKPEGERGAQIVVRGRVAGRADAAAYHRLKPRLMADVLASFDRIAAGADLVLVEGAGSPAEVNLRAGDLANMGFAEAADVPVVLVGDIDRGGVIASLVGTAIILAETERTRVKGYLVNKFRGDPSLFEAAHPEIERRTGWSSLGVVPWFDGARRLPAEDGASLDGSRFSTGPRGAGAIRVAVPRLPRIANFDDLDPLRAEPDVEVVLVEPGTAIPGDADLIVLPGSKATRADLTALTREGWALDIRAHVRRGGWVLGLCGGYQMLGRRISDPAGVEGTPGDSEGLALLDVETVLTGEKRLAQAAGHAADGRAAVSGYEMHMGETEGRDTARPFLLLDSGPDGARAPGGRVVGSYLHGLFTADEFRHEFLARMRHRNRSGVAYDASIDAALDGLAAHLAENIDVDRLLNVAHAREIAHAR